MTNFHTDDWIMSKVQEHYNEALNYFPKDQIVGIFLQGSQNYNLDYENSDIDTKLVITPSFKDIALNKKAVSTTHIRENEEHIDFKDVRLMLQTFKKQNVNFVEILFTKYKIINPLYELYWNELIKNKEVIAHYDKVAAVKTMAGMSREKFHAMEHPYPNKLPILKKFGYDPKQLHHLVRFNDFISRYIADEPYENCLIPINRDHLVDIKKGSYNLEEARSMAIKYMNNIDSMYINFINSHTQNQNEAINQLLENTQYKIMETSVKEEWK